jgi:integrase
LLVDHYRLKEFPMTASERKTRLTQRVYWTNLNRHILPRWGDYQLRKVSSVEVEDWLKSLLLASGTKAKLRNLMSAVFRHAIRYGWLGQYENPIAMVRVSAKRKRVPTTLTNEEFRALMVELPDRERAIGVICATTGLRVSEVLGLKWEDIDFVSGTANVFRSVTDGHVEHCKTETSQQPVPLDELTRGELLGAWWLHIALIRTGSSLARSSGAECQFGQTRHGKRSFSGLLAGWASPNQLAGTPSDIRTAHCLPRAATTSR